MDLVTLVDVLERTGGWGLSAVLIAWVWRLTARLEAKDERIFRMLDQQNKVLQTLERIERRN